MATGMFGANTQLLREIAGRFGTTSTDAATASTTSNSEVQRVEWRGPDADTFRRDYDAIVATEIEALATVLEGVERDLLRHADEQDITSSAQGQPSGPSGADPRGTTPWLTPGHWINLIFSDIRNPVRMLRFGLEAGYALTHPGSFGKFFTNSWTGITGYVPGWGATGAGLENAVSNSRVGRFYDGVRWLNDRLQFKNTSARLEAFLGASIDRVRGLEPLTRFVAGESGTVVQSMAQTTDRINEFFGKEGRMLGRVFGGVGIGMDGYSTITNLQDGNHGAAAYSGVKTVLGAASFIPGPVGWTAAGVSLGLAAYDNIPVVRDSVNWVGGKIADGWSAINPFD